MGWRWYWVWRWVARGNIQQFSYISHTEQHSPFGLMLLRLRNVTIYLNSMAWACISMCIVIQVQACTSTLSVDTLHLTLHVTPKAKSTVSLPVWCTFIYCQCTTLFHSCHINVSFGACLWFVMKLCVSMQKQTWFKLWRESKTTGIQQGIEPGTFRLLIWCSYHFFFLSLQAYIPAYTELHNNIVMGSIICMCSLHNLHNTKATGRHVTTWLEYCCHSYYSSTTCSSSAWGSKRNKLGRPISLGKILPAWLLYKQTYFCFSALIQWLSGKSIQLVIRRSQVQFPVGSLWIFLSLSPLTKAKLHWEEKATSKEWNTICKSAVLREHPAQGNLSWNQ